MFYNVHHFSKTYFGVCWAGFKLSTLLLSSRTKYPRNISALNERVAALEAFQNKTLKNLILCPKSASPSILMPFSGCMPMAARFDILKVRYY